MRSLEPLFEASTGTFPVHPSFHISGEKKNNQKIVWTDIFHWEETCYFQDEGLRGFWWCFTAEGCQHFKKVKPRKEDELTLDDFNIVSSRWVS